MFSAASTGRFPIYFLLRDSENDRRVCLKWQGFPLLQYWKYFKKNIASVITFTFSR